MQTSTGDCLPLQHCQTYTDKFTLILRLFELAPREMGTNLDLRAILLSLHFTASVNCTMTKCQNQLYVIHLNKIHCRCKLFYGDPIVFGGNGGGSVFANRV